MLLFPTSPTSLTFYLCLLSFVPCLSRSVIFFLNLLSCHLIFFNKRRCDDVSLLFVLVRAWRGHKLIDNYTYFSTPFDLPFHLHQSLPQRRCLFFLTSLDPGGELSRRFQLCGGGPNLSGVHSQRPVVSRAARHHIRRRAQELPCQVRDKTPSLIYDINV